MHIGEPQVNSRGRGCTPLHASPRYALEIIRKRRIIVTLTVVTYLALIK